MITTVRIRAVLIEQLFFSIFSVFFFQEQQEKQEKQVTFPKIGNLKEGKMFGRLRIPILIVGNKIWKIWKYKELREKKSLEISTKRPSIRTALTTTVTTAAAVYTLYTAVEVT